MNKQDLKDFCIERLSNGETITEIAKVTGKSRTYITNLIKHDDKYLAIKQNRKIKVYKRKHYKQMTIHIPTEFIKGIGISSEKTQNEYVNIFFDKENHQLIISKV